MAVMVTVVGHGCHGNISGDMAVMVICYSVAFFLNFCTSLLQSTTPSASSLPS